MSGLRASQPDEWDLSAGPLLVARVPGGFHVDPFPHCLAFAAGKDFRMSWSGVGKVLHGDAWIRDELEHPGWVTFGAGGRPDDDHFVAVGEVGQRDGVQSAAAAPRGSEQECGLAAHTGEDLAISALVHPAVKPRPRLERLGLKPAGSRFTHEVSPSAVPI